MWATNSRMVVKANIQRYNFLIIKFFGSGELPVINEDIVESNNKLDI